LSGPHRPRGGRRRRRVARPSPSPRRRPPREHVGLLPIDLAVDERIGEGRVEGLDDGGSSWDKLRDLRGGRAARLGGQTVPRLGIDRIRDVDDNLAVQPVGVLLGGVLDAGVVQRQHDHAAAEGSFSVERARGVAELVGELSRLVGLRRIGRKLIPAP
jgi:hypothetical protein